MEADVPSEMGQKRIREIKKIGCESHERGCSLDQ